MSNSISDLNAHLFAQLDRLSAESLEGDALEAEVKRAEAMVRVADQVTENAKLQLNAARLFAEHGRAVLPHLPQIGRAEPENEVKEGGAP